MKKYLVLIILLFPINIYALEINCPDVVKKQEVFSCSLKDDNVGLLTNFNSNNIFNYQKVEYKNGKLYYGSNNGISYSNIDGTIDMNIYFKVNEAAISDSVYTINFDNINLVNSNYENIFMDNIAKQIRIASDINTLDNIDISPYTLTPNFNKDINVYTSTVNTDNIDVKVEKTSILSTVSGNIGNVQLTLGANILKINVKSESGLINTYELDINRVSTIPVKKETKLKKLIVNKKEIKLEDNKYIYEYNVDSDVDVLDIEAKSSNKNDKIIIEKKDKLDYGENIITITIKGDYEVKYILKVYRENKIQEEYTSNADSIKPENTKDEKNNNHSKLKSNKLISEYFITIPLTIILILLLWFIRNKIKKKSKHQDK